MAENSSLKVKFRHFPDKINESLPCLFESYYEACLYSVPRQAVRSLQGHLMPFAFEITDIIWTLNKPVIFTLLESVF